MLIYSLFRIIYQHHKMPFVSNVFNLSRLLLDIEKRSVIRDQFPLHINKNGLRLEYIGRLNL